MGRDSRRQSVKSPEGCAPLLPAHCFSVDSKQYGEKIMEELPDPDPQMWRETKPGMVPPKRAGRSLFHLFHETCLHFFPSPACCPVPTVGCGVKKYYGPKPLSKRGGAGTPFCWLPSVSPLLSDSSLFSVSQVQAQPRMTVRNQISGRSFTSQRTRPREGRRHRLR